MTSESQLRETHGLLNRVIAKSHTNPRVARGMGPGLFSRMVLAHDVMDWMLTERASCLLGAIKDCAVILDAMEDPPKEGEEVGKE